MLTDERIDANVDSHFMKLNNLTPHQWRSFARAIEAEATAPLLARIAELEADAKRYRWLKYTANCNDGVAPMIQRCSDWGRWFWVQVEGNDLDAAIDAAMKEQP